MASADLIQTLTDKSGKVEGSVFREQVPLIAFQHQLSVKVAGDIVVVGGGDIGAVSPRGALLTESRPNDDLTAWMVSSNDHIAPEPHFFVGYALGLKIAGMTRDQLVTSVVVIRARGGPAPPPTVTATLPLDAVLVSGGFRAVSTDRNLATASYPEFQRSWTASTKDRVIPAPAVIETFAIDLRKQLGGPDGMGGITPLGNIAADSDFGESRLSNRPAVQQAPSTDVALTGIGAFVIWTDPGCLLWKLALEACAVAAV